MIWTFQDMFAMFWSSFVAVALLGLQSKNVNQSRYVAAGVTSLGISISQFVFVRYTMSGSYLALAILAAGGVLGIMASIYAHDNYFKQKPKKSLLS